MTLIDKFWFAPALGFCFLVGGILAVRKKPSSLGGLFCLAIGLLQVVILLAIYAGNKMFSTENNHTHGWIAITLQWIFILLAILSYSLPFAIILKNGIRKLGQQASFGQEKNSRPAALPETRGKDRIFEIQDREKPQSGPLQRDLRFFTKCMGFFPWFLLLFILGLLISGTLGILNLLHFGIRNW